MVDLGVGVRGKCCVVGEEETRGRGKRIWLVKG